MICKTIIWNARGVGNKPTIRRIKKMIKEHNIKILVILEPMLSQSRLASTSFNIGLPNSVSNADKHGKVWIF